MIEEETLIDEPILISQGAEAVIFLKKTFLFFFLSYCKKIYKINYLSDECILKERIEKKYRHPDLDKRLTTERMKAVIYMNYFVL